MPKEATENRGWTEFKGIKEVSIKRLSKETLSAVQGCGSTQDGPKMDDLP